MNWPGADELGELFDRLSALLVVVEELSEPEEDLVVEGLAESGHLRRVDWRIFEKDAANEVGSQAAVHAATSAPSEWPAMIVGRPMMVVRNACTSWEWSRIR